MTKFEVDPFDDEFEYEVFDDELSPCDLSGHEYFITHQSEVYESCVSCGESAVWDDRCPENEHTFCVSNDSFEYDRCLNCGADRREAYALLDGYISHVAGQGVRW